MKAEEMLFQSMAAVCCSNAIIIGVFAKTNKVL